MQENKFLSTEKKTWKQQSMCIIQEESQHQKIEKVFKSVHC